MSGEHKTPAVPAMIRRQVLGALYVGLMLGGVIGFWIGSVVT